jgi:hypothetical protein
LKKFVFFLIICFTLVLSSCGNHDLRQTIKTQFGDKIYIYAYLSGNLHGKYLHCEITAEDIEGYVYLSNKEITDIPSDIGSSVEPIAIYEDTHVYKLYNEFIVIQGKEIESFPRDYNLDNFISEVKYNGVKIDTVYFGAKALCNTKNFKYVSQFFPILEHVKNDEEICFIVKRWALGDFTEDELRINQDYTKEEISIWCKNYLNYGNTGAKHR